MAEGRLSASGRTADVYEWGDGQVLKLFRNGLAHADVERESQVASAVAAAGLAPAFHDVVQRHRRRAFVVAEHDRTSNGEVKGRGGCFASIPSLKTLDWLAARNP